MWILTLIATLRENLEDGIVVVPIRRSEVEGFQAEDLDKGVFDLLQLWLYGVAGIGNRGGSKRQDGHRS